MDDLSRLIYDYLQWSDDPSKKGLNAYVVKYSPYRNKETDIISRLLVFLQLFEEQEEYEICHSIKTILQHYETKGS